MDYSGEFGSLCFHGLLSINLLINSISPFSDGSVLRRYFIPIYLFCLIYPILRLTVWRLIYYKSLDINRKSELPWEGAIGIILVFILDVCSLYISYYNVGKLDKRLGHIKKYITIQMMIYLVVFIVCYTGPLIFRIQYLIDKNYENVDNPLFIWSETSAPFIGLLNACVWVAMPTLRDAIKYKIFKFKKHEGEPLISRSDRDWGQLYLLLRKNLLVTTLMGIRAIVTNYTPKK